MASFEGENISLFHTHDHSKTANQLNLAAESESNRWHISGVVLPDGEKREIWIHDGLISFEPVREAQTLATNCWIMPGFVDAHNHIGLDKSGAVSETETEQQAILEREAGVLLIRDAGSPAETSWIDQRTDLPKVIRAGRHIARPKRYLRNYAAEVDPTELVAETIRQAKNGDGWVKLVGDWIDRNTGDLAPLWPIDIAKAAIQAAHHHGAKVTAHCFGEQSVAELVQAGIDGIEHGTGASDEVIAEMAEKQVALVPTMINLETFPAIAAQADDKFPTYAAHMRKLYSNRYEVFRKAKEAGVPIYAGTDAGGGIIHGLIAEEIELLASFGGADFALGAASWRARNWLEQQNITAGAPADLVIFEVDPHKKTAVTRHPKFIILRGVVYRGSI